MEKSTAIEVGAGTFLGGLGSMFTGLPLVAAWVATGGGALILILALTPYRDWVVQLPIHGKKLLIPPATESVFVSTVSATIDKDIVTVVCLTLVNPNPVRAQGISVSVVVEHRGSKTMQDRTINVPPNDESELVVNASYPADRNLTVEGVVEHEEHTEPFCFRFYGMEGQQFIACDDDVRRHILMSAEAGSYSVSGENAGYATSIKPVFTNEHPLAARYRRGGMCYVGIENTGTTPVEDVQCYFVNFDSGETARVSFPPDIGAEALSPVDDTTFNPGDECRFRALQVRKHEDGGLEVLTPVEIDTGVAVGVTEHPCRFWFRATAANAERTEFALAVSANEAGGSCIELEQSLPNG